MSASAKLGGSNVMKAWQVAGRQTDTPRPLLLLMKATNSRRRLYRLRHRACHSRPFFPNTRTGENDRAKQNDDGRRIAVCGPSMRQGRTRWRPSLKRSDGRAATEGCVNRVDGTPCHWVCCALCSARRWQAAGNIHARDLLENALAVSRSRLSMPATNTGRGRSPINRGDRT